MVELSEIDKQLKEIGLNNRFFGRPEVRELRHILADDEKIDHAVNGHYEGGFALLLTTDRRVLLIDKKPFFLSMEDIRYAMISEVDLCTRLLDTTITINTIRKQLRFMSWSRDRLRDLMHHVQHRVMELRQQGGDDWQVQLQSQVAAQASSVPQQTTSNLASQTQTDDFVTDYQALAKRNSLAQLAGHIAMSVERAKPIVRPLFPRPSLVNRYKSNNLAHNSFNGNFDNY